MKRFWDKVRKTRGCWHWIGAKDNNGYGRIGINGHNRKAHRVLFEMLNGPISTDLCVCHTCDNPSCVNPSHLFIGTRKDNAQDSKRKGRYSSRAGINNGRAKLTEQDVITIRKSPLSNKMVGDQFGLNRKYVYAVRVGLRWGHIREDLKNG